MTHRTLTNAKELSQTIVRACTAGVNAAQDYIAPSRYGPSCITPDDLAQVKEPIRDMGAQVETEYPDHVLIVRTSVSIIPRDVVIVGQPAEASNVVLERKETPC